MQQEEHSLSSTKLPSPAGQYWTLQIGGWLALTMLSYLSLTLWYHPGQWIYAFHTLLQSALGLLVSHPLRYVARRTWEAPIGRRIAANAAAIVLASLLWTALRLASFTWLTGEAVSPTDYGGWLFASVIVFGSWDFCYHALKYYRQWMEGRERIIAAERATLQARARAHEENAKRLYTESLYQEARLRMLKYQLNPHFLFNALNSVSSLVRRGEAAKASAMLGRIGDFLRVSLEQDDELDHTLAQEIEVLELYLSIEKERFGSRLRTSFEVTPEARKVSIPGLLLQPLFENAMKYAVGRSLDPTTISLKAWVEDDMLELRVADTGPGVASDTSGPGKTSTGIGLKNVEQRLRSSYSDAFRLQIMDNEPHGFLVEISVPASRQVEQVTRLAARPRTPVS